MWWLASLTRPCPHMAPKWVSVGGETDAGGGQGAEQRLGLPLVETDDYPCLYRQTAHSSWWGWCQRWMWSGCGLFTENVKPVWLGSHAKSQQRVLSLTLLGILSNESMLQSPLSWAASLDSYLLASLEQCFSNLLLSWPTVSCDGHVTSQNALQFAGSVPEYKAIRQSGAWHGQWSVLHVW